MKHSFNSEFSIGDRVYHATPESDLGIVIDISYSIANNRVKYLVTFGRVATDEIWACSEELSLTKSF